MKEYTITDIEEMTEADCHRAFAHTAEIVPLKGFRIYLVDIAGRFGYSMIVFGNGQQIKYANDYQLNHDYKPITREELRELYLKKADRTLFTEEELAQPLKSYDDFQRRRKFVSELLPLEREHLSVFYYIRTEEEKAAREEERKQFPILCPPAFGYFREEDKEFATHISELFEQLMQQEKDIANNYEYNFNAFYYEMGNHEYHIDYYQADWDTLSAFGNIPWRGQSEEAREQYFDDLGFTDTQKKAYRDARRKFLKDAEKNGWY